MSYFHITCRQCLTDEVRYKDGDRYCVDGCRAVTECGDLIIPEEHLEVVINSLNNKVGVR